MYAYASDPENDRYTPWTHYQSIEEARADLDKDLAAYDLDGLGAWGIEHRDQGRLIGIIYISPPNPRHRWIKMGFTIAKSHWGKVTQAKPLRQSSISEASLLDVACV